MGFVLWPLLHWHGLSDRVVRIPVDSTGSQTPFFNFTHRTLAAYGVWLLHMYTCVDYTGLLSPKSNVCVDKLHVQSGHILLGLTF